MRKMLQRVKLAVMGGNKIQLKEKILLNPETSLYTFKPDVKTNMLTANCSRAIIIPDPVNRGTKLAITRKENPTIPETVSILFC
jgi:hypothetical protein